VSVPRSTLTGFGGYLPERVMTNDELAKTVDTSDEWIVERTGIHCRHIAANGQATSDLAFEAAKAALVSAGADAAEVDMIILATATPDETFPATATKVQQMLGMTRGAAFDVQAVCTGFIFALATADNFIKVGQAETILVIGAETFSRILDWTDRSTCVLFGDGAGAVLLRAGEGDGSSQDRGILSNSLHSDGSKHDLLYADGGPSTTQNAGVVKMEGRQVFKQAVTNLAAVVGETLEGTGLTISDVDWLVPHQANRRILDSTAKKLGMPEGKVVITVGDHANTSAASVPLALSTAVADGRIKPGDLVMMEAMGAGMTWGACLARI
jgi:3-oxoacyl-[acyl-carrier-protein] synthase-3